MDKYKKIMFEVEKKCTVALDILGDILGLRSLWSNFSVSSQSDPTTKISEKLLS